MTNHNTEYGFLRVITEDLDPEDAVAVLDGVRAMGNHEFRELLEERAAHARASPGVVERVRRALVSDHATVPFVATVLREHRTELGRMAFGVREQAWRLCCARLRVGGLALNTIEPQLRAEIRRQDRESSDENNPWET